MKNQTVRTLKTLNCVVENTRATLETLKVERLENGDADTFTHKHIEDLKVLEQQVHLTEAMVLALHNKVKAQG